MINFGTLCGYHNYTSYTIFTQMYVYSYHAQYFTCIRSGSRFLEGDCFSMEDGPHKREKALHLSSSTLPYKTKQKNFPWCTSTRKSLHLIDLIYSCWRRVVLKKMGLSPTFESLELSSHAMHVKRSNSCFCFICSFNPCLSPCHDSHALSITIPALFYLLY